MKTLEELKKLDAKKLLEELDLVVKELFKIKFEIKTAQVKNNHDIKKQRRQIARIKTILKQQTLTQDNNEI